MKTLLCLLLALCLAVPVRAEIGSLPPIEIARGLPSHERCVEASKTATAWYDAESRACAALPWAPGSYFAALEASWVWRYAEWATDPARTEEQRRAALRDLIERVGWRATLTGELPLPYPQP